jgi:glycosyltransferase involved in cell wall biosynthesis
MSDNGLPKISIGLPVYNGENFLKEALDSILSQTFKDFEIIISDNASTDRTETICREYAAHEPRIRYFRSRFNLGASNNFNRVLTLSTGKYFKWISHDDLHDRNFLSKCIQVLDNDHSVVLVYTKAITIDGEGRTIRKEWGTGREFGSVKTHKRFKEGLSPPCDPIPLPIFGVVRANILRKSQLMEGYPDCDRALLAELSLYGRFYRIPEPLFLQREHKNRAGPSLSENPYWAVTFWDSRKIGKIVIPHWALLHRYLLAIYNAPLSLHDRFCCHKELGKWIYRQWRLLIKDLIIVAGRIPICGPLVTKAYKKFSEMQWNYMLRNVEKEIDSYIPESETLILVDDAAFGIESFANRSTLPFLECGGKYNGPPIDDNNAIQELERMRGIGAQFMVFGWPSFWWLKYYSEFHGYLIRNYSCVLQNSRVVVFDLRK